MPRELIRNELLHDRSRSLGWAAVWWIETFCLHGPGDVQGEPVVLDDEFTEIIVDCYALDKSGRRLYDSAFISRAKGRAKSELAGFITLWEAFGQCRFERWARGGETWRFRGEVYTYEPGEPIGQCVTYPFIRCLATEEGQAGNTYDNVHFNLTSGPLSIGLPKDTAGLTRVILPQGGEIVPSTASSASKDGGKETFCTFDETHLYVLPDLKQMYRTVRRNLAKRKASEPWSLETSTMYAPGEDSVAEETHKLAMLIREGKTRQARTLFDHRFGDPDTNLADPEELLAALRDAYGPFADVMDLGRIISEVHDPRNPPSDSRRYFLNCETSAADAWLTGPEVTAAVDATKVVADKAMIGLGFDGSVGVSRVDAVADSTALIATRIRDGHQWAIGIWEQPSGVAGRGWVPPELEIQAALEGAHEQYNVIGFFGDPAGWSERMATWTAKWGAGYLVKMTADQPIRWKTNQHTRWAETLKAYRAAIVGGRLTIDGSYAFVQHLLNARNRVTRSGLTISKRDPDSKDKIDGAIAGTYSYAVYLQAIAAGVLNAPIEESWVPVRVR
jgi:hypothetical protein